MKNIRHSVFETNSSSSHSISISKDNKDNLLDTLPVNEGVCEIEVGEFGWGYDSYTDAASKASYALTHARDSHADSARKLEMLKKVIQEQTGAKTVSFNMGKIDRNYYIDGYIDNQSVDVCEEAFKSEKNLRNFIFNKRSTLIIDNDNH